MSNDIPLGYAKVYQDAQTGELIVDEDTIRRSGFGDDDFEGCVNGECAGEGDDFEGEDDEFGRRGGRDERQDNRRDRKDDRRDNKRDRKDDRRENKRDRQDDRRENKRDRQDTRRGKDGNDDQDIDIDVNTVNSNRGMNTSGWVSTAVSESTNLGAAGMASVQITVQHDFKAKDITFEGSLAGTKVNSVVFGDRTVWSSTTGVPITVFSPSSTMREIVKGQTIRAGLTITVTGTLTGAGDLVATLAGEKPYTGC